MPSLTTQEHVDAIVALQARIDLHIKALLSDLDNLTEQQYLEVEATINSKPGADFMFNVMDKWYGATAERRALGIPE